MLLTDKLRTSVRNAMHSLADFRVECVLSDYTTMPELLLSCCEHTVRLTSCSNQV